MNQTPKRKKPLRAINEGPKSETGRARQRLYRHHQGRIAEAIKAGFYLEAITLIESMVADRLEARLAHIHHQIPEKRKFSTLGNLLQELSGEKCNESEASQAIYTQVADWAGDRNRALHELVKLEEGSCQSWSEKYGFAKQTAEDGRALFRRLDALIKKLNNVRPRE